MSKLKKMIADKVKSANDEVVNVEKMPTAKVDKATFAENSKASTYEEFSKEGQRILEAGAILKTFRKNGFTDADRFAFEKALRKVEKAPLMTTDITEIIPSGYTGTLLEDIMASTALQNIIETRVVSAGTSEGLNVFGTVSYETAEGATPTESADSYTDQIFLPSKLMAKTFMTYESVADTNIDLLLRARTSLVRSLGYGIEKAILSGDLAGTMDADFATDGRGLCNGLRLLGKTKKTVDFTGASLSDAELRAKILEMQEASGLYMDENQVAMGDVYLVVDQNLYNKMRNSEDFVDASKSGAGSTVAGGKGVATFFGIPVVVSSFLSKYNASGVVDAVSGNNTLGSCVMFNKATLNAYTTGAMNMGYDDDVEYEKYLLTSSIRWGFNSIFDRSSANPSTINASKVNVVTGVNIFR